MAEESKQTMDTEKLLELLGEYGHDNENVKMNLLEQMETYTPSIPEAVITHFMNKSGCKTSDVKMYSLY